MITVLSQGARTSEVLVQIFSEPLGWHCLVIQALCSTVQEVSNWLLNQINNPEDVQAEKFMSTLERNEDASGPGQFLVVLESFITSSEETEVGSRIFEALKTWSKADSARKTVMAQQIVLREFLQICESKRKLLEKLKQQMSHV
ncbi:hypothetical protein Bca4012_058687 [Brassica carinata]